MRRTLALKQWQLGYLAGMVDAECHVGTQREMGPRQKTPAYTIRFELAMTDKKVIDFVNALLPSAKQIYVAARSENRLPYYRLRLTTQEALRMLRSVLPYVQGKRRQIEICFAIEALRKQHSPSKRHNGALQFRAMPVEFDLLAKPLFDEFRSLQLNKRPQKPSRRRTAADRIATSLAGSHLQSSG